MSANLFAWLALLMWPIASVLLYRLLSLPVALCTTIIGGYLLLPERISVDLPILPALDKHTIPGLCALALTALSVRQPDQRWPVQHGWLPKSLVVRGLIGLLLVGAFGTAMTNGEALHYGLSVLPGLRPYDAFSIILALAMSLFPFVLGRKVLASPKGQELLLIALAISAAAYAFLALYEVRMSPQLNKTVYGFFPHSWHQHIRGDGFRPLVFLNHGLWLGLYLAMAVLAAVGLLFVDNTKNRGIWLLVGMWLVGTLFLAKSLGPLMITLFLLPIFFFFSKRMQVLATVVIAAVVLTFPLLRTTNLIPFDQVTSFAAKVSPEREQSFQFRLDNEEDLLAKAREKPLFGWGGWARSHVIDEHGRDTSTTDGFWIIALGQGGWFRYISVFGLLSWGILALLRRHSGALQRSELVLALLMAANLIDLIPNATLTPITWLIAGALTGGLEQGATVKRVPDERVLETERASGVVLARNFQKTDARSRQTQPVFRRPMVVKSAPAQSKVTLEEARLSKEPRYRRDFPKRNTTYGKKR